MRLSRNDSIRLDEGNVTYFTNEGYLIDEPVVTSVGIFEYTNSDGSKRRELRLPEEVFNKDSLASYEGKPIIITHEAGIVNKNNVKDEQIGTILSKGFKAGEDVKAKIVIHDTDDMKDCGLKELSLGYNLDLEEESGEWHGQHYDAVQRNIRINHLALVSNARAGEQARLNIDSKDIIDTTRGGKVAMRKNITRHDEDSVMSPDELQKAIEAFRNRKANRLSAKDSDAELPMEESEGMEENAFAENIEEEVDAVENSEPMVEEEITDGVEEMEEVEEPVEVEATEEVMDEEPMGMEEKIQFVKDRRARRDAEEEPQDEKALGAIAQMDEDIDTLLGVIDEMKKDGCCGKNTDGCAEKPWNEDSADELFALKWNICKVGEKMNLDGLEKLKTMDSMKKVIKKAKPSMNLDGKSKSYVKGVFDAVAYDISDKKSTVEQRKTMTTRRSDSAEVEKHSASEARRKLIERREGGIN